MKDERKTKSLLIGDLREARQRIEVLAQMVERSDLTTNGNVRGEGKAVEIFEHLPLGYQYLDENARVLYVNGAWTQLMGYPKAQAIGRSFFDFVALEEQKSLKDDFNAFKPNGEVHDVERTLIRADGSRLFVAIDGKTVRDAGGELRIHCILKDKTTQRQTEAKLREREHNLRSLVESIDSVFWVSTPGATEQLYVSPTFERIWGRPLEEALSVPGSFLSSIHPDDRKGYLSVLKEYHSQCKSYEHEYRIIKPNGEIRWIRERGFPGKDCTNEKLLMKGICTDITERKQAEEALVESESRYRFVTENFQVVLYSAKPGRRLTDVFITGPIERLTGYTREELVEDPALFEQILHPDDRKRVLGQIKEQWRSRTPLDVEFRIVTKRGEVKWVRDRAVARLNDNGVIERIGGVFEDVTAKKTMEQELERSQSELKVIYEHAPVMMCTLDAERRVVYANDAFTKFTGVSEAELHDGRACGVVGCINATEDPAGCGFGPSCRDCLLRQAIEDTLQTGRSHRDVEYRATLVRGADKRAVVLLACTARIPAVEQALVLLCLHDITARVQAQEAALASAEELRLTLDATTDGIWEWDFRTDELFFSPRYYTMLGYKPGEFPPTFDSWAGLIHSEDREQALGVAARYLETKPDAYENEFRLRTKAGHYRWIQARAHVVERNEKGQAARMIGNHHDITDFRETEAALRLSEKRLKRAQEVAKTGSWEWHPASGETHWSDQVYRLFGLEPGEIDPSYELARRFVHPDDLTLWESSVADAVHSGSPFRCDYRAIRPDGEVVWVHNEAEITRDHSGKAEQFFGTVQDVTELHRTMESLKERNREFELIFNSVPAIIVLRDAHRRHLKVNREAIEAVGIEEEGWINKTIGEILPKYARRYDRVDREVLRNGQAQRNILELYESTRGIRWLRTTKVPIRDDRGKVCGLVGFGIDVTEEILAQNELKERLIELEKINRFVIRSTRFRTVDSMCNLAANTVHRIIRGAVVLVSFIDPAVGGPRLRAVAGLGKRRAEISGLLKAEPETIWGRVEEMGEQARAHAAVFTSGRLEEVPGGFVTICDGMIPRETSERIVTLLGIERVYTVGLTLDKRILGGLSLLLPSGKELHHQNTVEIIARHLSVVLHRLLGEEELRNSRSRFRQLALRTRNLLENQAVTISRELHDDLGQSLTALAMDLALLDQDLRKRSTSMEQLAGIVGDMRSLLNDSLDKVKNLSHLLRPTILDTASIVEALQWQLEEFGRRSEVRTKLRLHAEPVELEKAQSVAVFRCVQEALTNCARHSRAGNVEMAISKRKTHLVVRVRDDGVGFDPNRLDPAASLGLLGLQEHAAACGGRAEIQSQPGMGTTVTILVPLEIKR
jgi:PAS domain S-box-containing protein